MTVLILGYALVIRKGTNPFIPLKISSMVHNNPWLLEQIWILIKSKC